MIPKGPFQPLTFCDSVILSSLAGQSYSKQMVCRQMPEQPKENTATLPHKSCLRINGTVAFPSDPALITMMGCKRFEQFYAVADTVLHGGLYLLGILGRHDPEMLYCR